MTKVELNHSWPVGDLPKCGLPLPFVDYTGGPRVTALTSDSAAFGRILRRSRFQIIYATVQALWVLSAAEYDIFQEFFEEIVSGISRFPLELRYPKNNSLAEWECAFGDGYSVEYADGRWRVSASLDLLRPTLLPNLAPLL